MAGLRRWKLTEGIALAVIPAVAYACAFLFELGYCHYLRIPAQFIAITTNDRFKLECPLRISCRKTRS